MKLVKFQVIGQENFELTTLWVDGNMRIFTPTRGEPLKDCFDNDGITLGSDIDKCS